MDADALLLEPFLIGRVRERHDSRPSVVPGEQDAGFLEQLARGRDVIRDRLLRAEAPRAAGPRARFRRTTIRRRRRRYPPTRPPGNTCAPPMNAVPSCRRTMKTSGPAGPSRSTTTVAAGRGFATMGSRVGTVTGDNIS